MGEEVLRQSTVRLVGIENTALLLSLFDGLMAHERALSSYWKGGTKPLKAHLLDGWSKRYGYKIHIRNR